MGGRRNLFMLYCLVLRLCVTLPDGNGVENSIMIITKKILIILFMIAGFAIPVISQTKPAEDKPNIVDHIISDSLSVVVMEPGMEWLLEYDEPGPKRPANLGYRVQVFSDSNQRTAKNEARTKQRSVASRFSKYPIYVTFASPYWRVKVGDFVKMEEAEELAKKIRRAFPSFAREVRVVRDRINLPKNASN